MRYERLLCEAADHGSRDPAKVRQYPPMRVEKIIHHKVTKITKLIFMRNGLIRVKFMSASPG
jgi:hypothetical protein